MWLPNYKCQKIFPSRQNTKMEIIQGEFLHENIPTPEQFTVIFTFIFDLNYFLWKLKTSKRQGVSSLLETKHKVFRFKTKPIP